jgi:hypothetical protein
MRYRPLPSPFAHSSGIILTCPCWCKNLWPSETDSQIKPSLVSCSRFEEWPRAQSGLTELLQHLKLLRIYIEIELHTLVLNYIEPRQLRPAPYLAPRTTQAPTARCALLWRLVGCSCYAPELTGGRQKWLEGETLRNEEAGTDRCNAIRQKIKTSDPSRKEKPRTHLRLG